MSTLEKLRAAVKTEHDNRGWKNTQANYKKLVKEIFCDTREKMQTEEMRLLWDIMRTSAEV